MQTFCQKFTTSIQDVLKLTNDFDEQEKVRANIVQLQSTRDNVNDELTSALSEYQEFLWPPERFPRINIQVGGDAPEELNSKLEEIDDQGMEKLIISPTTKQFFAEIYESHGFKGQSKKQEEIKIIIVKASDLGPNLIKVGDIVKNTKGLVLVPPNVIPYIALNYPNMPEKKDCYIASRFFINLQGFPTLFELFTPKSNQPWIHSVETSSDCVFAPDIQLIFMLPPNQKSAENILRKQDV